MRPYRGIQIKPSVSNRRRKKGSETEQEMRDRVPTDTEVFLEKRGNKINHIAQGVSGDKRNA